MTQLTDALDEAMARAMCDANGQDAGSGAPGERRWQTRLHEARAARLALAAALAERGLKVVSAEVTYGMMRAALERPSSEVARTVYEDIWPAMLPVAPDLLGEGGE
jgi:hypothetical protein